MLNPSDYQNSAINEAVTAKLRKQIERANVQGGGNVVCIRENLDRIGSELIRLDEIVDSLGEKVAGFGQTPNLTNGTSVQQICIESTVNGILEKVISINKRLQEIDMIL